MKKILFFALFFCAAFFVPNLVFAQEPIKDTTQLYVVKTIDDNEYIGSIGSQNAEILVLKTEALGEITIQKKNIKSITPLQKDQIVEGQYWFENPHTTRYFFSQTATACGKAKAITKTHGFFSIRSVTASPITSLSAQA